MVWKDQLVKYNDQDINYDDIGNPTKYLGAGMTWLGRQMMSYQTDDLNISYTYDSDGLRTSKTVNGVKHNYYYVDGQLRYERNGDSYEIYYTYDADGRPVLATKRDLVAKKNYQYYLITNTRGDVIETRNGDGNVNARFVYDAWGKLVAVTNASGTPLSQNSFAYQISLKYRGYVYDNETGLYYLQSRYYDPETGRFLNADDNYIIDYSLLLGELLLANNHMVENNVQLYASLSSYGVARNIYDDFGNIFAIANLLNIAIYLFEQNNISTLYLSMPYVEIYPEIFYKVDGSNDAVIKVTITAMDYKNYDSLTSGYYQTIYQTIFYTGSWDAWSMYLIDSLSARQKNTNGINVILSLFSMMVGIASIFNPVGQFFKLMEALDVALAIYSGVSTTVSYFELARLKKFDNYVTGLLKQNYGKENITFLFSVIDKTIVYANQKREIIYKAV